MSNSGKKYKISIVIVLLLCALYPSPQVQAGEPSLPPHLIQTVRDQDVYEGLAALGMLQAPVLTEADQTAARENVQEGVVRLIMGNAYGSGVVFRLTADAVIVATNRHVLEYWDDAEGIVRFPKGYFVSAVSLGSAEDCDVGFLRVENSEFPMETLLTLRSVPLDEEVCDGLAGGTPVFCLGADRTVGETVYQEAVVEEPLKYIADFDGDMLYCRGFAKEGMSGGGIFDGYGHLIGLLAGGTYQNEIAGVPLGDVLAAYRELVGE